MLAPERDGGRWHYTLFIEDEAPAILTDALENELRFNPHYALCRDLGQLGPVQILPVGNRAYEIFCAEATAQGRRLGEVKPESLSRRPDWRKRFDRSSAVA